MLTTKQSILISGSSDITINDEKYFVASISATINNGNINITKTISNKEMFNTYKDEVQKDFSDFEAYVYNLEV